MFVSFAFRVRWRILFENLRTDNKSVCGRFYAYRLCRASNTRCYCSRLQSHLRGVGSEVARRSHSLVSILDGRGTKGGDHKRLLNSLRQSYRASIAWSSGGNLYTDSRRSVQSQWTREHPGLRGETGLVFQPSALFRCPAVCKVFPLEELSLPD